MLVDFKSLNKNSRVWVFQSVTLIDDYLVETIKEKLTLFLSEWKSHQNNVKSSFEIISNTFIIIAVDENNLVLRFLIFPGDDSPSPADFQIYTYNYYNYLINFM